MASITKLARTVTSPNDIPKEVGEAVATAVTPHRGPVFLDFPLDVVFAHGQADVPSPVTPAGAEPDADEVARAAALIAGAERPVLVAGSDVWWNGAWDALRRCVEELRVPTFVNGMGRGCLPADHELAFARTRRFLKQADVVVVVGTPLDFRLSFGSFGSAQVVHVVDSPDQRAAHVQVAVSPAGDLTKILDGFASHTGQRADHEGWIAQLRAEEDAARGAEKAELESDADPIHPARVYGELRKRLARDAVVIGDGGDFVSYAGKLRRLLRARLLAGPRPLRLPGHRAWATRSRPGVAHPDRQVVLMLGDGAIGFNGMDFDTLVRHQLPVVAIVGNNGIWGLEKHPMQAIYGYDVAADLQPGLRYDDVVKALGGAGETVSSPSDLGPALDRAFAAGGALPGQRPDRPGRRLPEVVQPRLTSPAPKNLSKIVFSPAKPAQIVLELERLCCASGRLYSFFHEAVALDDDAGDLAGGDQAVVGAHGDDEAEAAAFDGFELGFAADGAADGDGKEMVELTRTPTVVVPGSRWSTRARTVASSARATTRGVASMGTLRSATASAVSPSSPPFDGGATRPG